MTLSDTVVDARSAVPQSSPGTGRRRSEPRTYDFRRPTKLSREHVRILQIAQEAFARQATTVLTSMLRTGARMELDGIEQYSYDDYIATLPAQCFIATFTLDPLPGKGLLVYPLDTAMAIGDHRHLTALAALRFANPSSPFFAGTKLPSRKGLAHSSLP